MKITYKQIDSLVLLVSQIFLGLLALYFILGIAQILIWVIGALETQ